MGFFSVVVGIKTCLQADYEQNTSAFMLWKSKILKQLHSSDASFYAEGTE